MAGDIEIKEVKTRKELMEFIKFPWKVYQKDPYWVPPLINDVKLILSQKNPFWHHAEKELFLARRDGKSVGRISAIVDQNYINFHNEKTGFFGFFESVEDYTVAENLFNKAREWLKGKGMEKMAGPMNPSTNDEVGVLIEGFDSSPYILMTYNPKYYIDFMEKYGLVKGMDFFAYSIEVDKAPLERLEKVAKKIREKNPDVKIRQGNLKNWKNEVENVRTIYNNAWEKNWGFVPWTKEEFYTEAMKLKPFLVPGTIPMAEVDGKAVGMLVTVPNYNEVTKRMNGKLNPWTILKFLWYRKKINTQRLPIMGVVKEYQKRGIETLLMLEGLKGSQKVGYKYCECSWVLEDNILTQRAAEFMGGKVYKKYRVYQATI